MAKRIYDAHKVTPEIQKRGYTHTYEVKFCIFMHGIEQPTIARYIANGPNQHKNVEKYWKWQYQSGPNIKFISVSKTDK